MTFRGLFILVLVGVFLLWPTAGAVNLIFVDSKDDPGMVKAVDPEKDSRKASTIYTRPSGGIDAAACGHYGLYFSDGQDIFMVNASTGERRIHHHESNVRDLKVRYLQGSDRLYFSDATGAGGNGIIYYLNRSGGEVPYYNVGYTMKLTDVAGFLDGNFAFGDGDTLYLSNGDHVPSSIYLISGAGSDRVFGNLTKIYTDARAPILGMHYDGDKGIYYADGKAGIYRLDLNMNSLRKEKVYSGSHVKINDLSLAYGAMARGRFVASISSEKYHLPSCPWTGKISPKNEVWFATPEEAGASGHQPCKNCNPPLKS